MKSTGRHALPLRERKSHENKRHSMRNTVSDTVTVLHGGGAVVATPVVSTACPRDVLNH